MATLRSWRERYPLPARQTAKLLGVSLLRLHLYETGCFRFDSARENAVLHRMLQGAAALTAAERIYSRANT
ncbi:MAG TPA: hypothetical protein VGD78_02920 [Chthoniobacterales bacterium]